MPHKKCQVARACSSSDLVAASNVYRFFRYPLGQLTAMDSKRLNPRRKDMVFVSEGSYLVESSYTHGGECQNKVE